MSGHCLPVDAASTLGVVCILGSILPAKSLSAEALTTSRSILQSLGLLCSPMPLVAIQENGTKLTLPPRSDGKFALSDLKTMFKNLGLNFARLAEVEKIFDIRPWVSNIW